MEHFFDIVFSGLALIVLSSLLVPIVLILRFSGEGEIFFLQERIGKGGEVFKLFKFATLLKDSPNMGTGTVTMKGDRRVLPVGKFLRKTKFNELSQLLNTLFGNMSGIALGHSLPKFFKFHLSTSTISCLDFLISYLRKQILLFRIFIIELDVKGSIYENMENI